MQLLPDREQGRPLAIILLAVVLLVIYLVCFHWFILRHQTYAETISDLREQLGGVQLRLEQKPLLESRLQELRTERQDDAFFLREANFDAAAAQLAARLKGIINTQAENPQRCVVQSTQNTRPRDRERFEQVVVKVRMRCTLPDFIKVLDELESGLPLVFIDRLNVYQQAVSNNRTIRRGRNRGLAATTLDIRFDMLGYLRTSGEKA